MAHHTQKGCAISDCHAGLHALQGRGAGMFDVTCRAALAALACAGADIRTDDGGAGMSKMTLGKMLGLCGLALVGGLALHLFFIEAASLLYILNYTLGKVLAVCGLNGVFVTEKPVYMWPLYLLYISAVIAGGTFVTVLLKRIIEQMISPIEQDK